MTRLLSLIFICLLLSAAPARAEEQTAFKAPLQRQLESLILPEVKFRDSDFAGALRYLSQKAERQSDGKIRTPFLLDLPEDFETRYELTLDLRQVPFWEALRYLGEQAGVEYSFEGASIVIQPRGTESARQAARREGKPAPPAAGPRRGLTGVLGKPAEAVAAGGNVHRSTGGVVQAEKSGYVPRRAMGGAPTTMDGRHGVDVNCVRVTACPGNGCGCAFCTCKREPPRR